MATTPKGNLICISSYYSSSTINYFYGLKKNGRSYFSKNGEETSFESINSNKARNEGNIYAINLNGEDDKEYIITFGKNEAFFELYNFEDNHKIYYANETDLFDIGYNYFQYASIFKLKNSNYYIIAFVAPTKQFSQTFFIKKLLFTNLDISNHSPIVKTASSTSTFIMTCSCFESNNNLIICFYLEQSNVLKIIAYDDEFNQNAITSINSATYANSDFYKCIHFFGNTGAFLYYDTDNNISIQFKRYNLHQFFDQFHSIQKIQIINNNYLKDSKKCDMIRLEDKKFCYVTLSSDFKELNLFVINNYLNEKIKIRHYIIRNYNLYNFKIKEELNLSLYNKFIALSCIISYDTENSYGSLIIFSYPNSTDFSIDITDNLISFTNPIIKFYEKCQIENNIFGYVFAGFKIIDFSNGLKLICEDDKEVLDKECITSNNTNIEVILTKDINIQEKLRIEYTMVTIQPEYEIYNQYPIETIETYCQDNCNDEKGDENGPFKREWHFGRTSYCDLNINLEKITDDCDNNCKVCLKNDNKDCIVCRYLYELYKSGRKKCLDENEIPRTGIIDDEITTIPTEKSSFPTEISTILIEKSSIPSEISTISNEISSIPTEISTISNEISSIPTEISTISTEVITTTTLTEITTLSSEKTSFPNIEITNMSSEVTTISKETNTKLSEEIKESILETEKNFNNGSSCSIGEILNNKCKDRKITNNQTEEIKKNLMINYKNKNKIIKTENIKIQLSKLEDQKNFDDSDISNIDLGDCESKLKNANDIRLEESLIIYKKDIKTEDLSSTYVEFEVYEPTNLKKLNLSVCFDTQIIINVPVILNNNVESLYNSLSESGYNLFNKSDSFYNDICSTYTSQNGTDILLIDRKKDIYAVTQSQNMCQTGCELKLYNSTTQKAKCDCDIKLEALDDNNLNIEDLFPKKDEIAKDFYNTLSNSNFRVLKCYKLILNFKNILKNKGEILMSVLFILFIILTIIYGIIGPKKIHFFIN